MEDLGKELISYREGNSYSIEECAQQLNITPDMLLQIEEGKASLSSDEIARIKEIIKPKSRTGRRIVKILDLMFRFCATIMALVVLLLCINGYSETNTLIALLSIGVMCSSFTMLPKIDK